MDYPPMPHYKILKAGVLDGEDIMESETLEPKMEQYTARRPAWLSQVSGTIQFEGQRKG